MPRALRKRRLSADFFADLRFHQLTPLIHCNAFPTTQRHAEVIAGVAKFTHADQCTFFYKVNEITRRGCRRCAGDSCVLACRESACESFWAFPEHAQKCF